MGRLRARVLVYWQQLLNGEQFDSSRDKGRPFQFVIGKKNVIKGTHLASDAMCRSLRLILPFGAGWDEGVMTMSVGERALFVISPSWAYGESGIDPVYRSLPLSSL